MNINIKVIGVGALLCLSVCVLKMLEKYIILLYLIPSGICGIFFTWKRIQYYMQNKMYYVFVVTENMLFLPLIKKNNL